MLLRFSIHIMFMSRSLKTEALRIYSLRFVTLCNYFHKHVFTAIEYVCYAYVLFFKKQRNAKHIILLRFSIHIMFTSRSLKTEALRMYSLRFVTLHNYFHFVSSYHEKLHLIPGLFLNPPLCHIT